MTLLDDLFYDELIGYDFDGTLIQLTQDTSGSADVTQWHPTPLLKNLTRLPGRKIVITGRTHERARGIANYVYEHGYTLVEGVHAQEAWTGHRDAVAWKARMIRELGVAAYIGDQRLDEEAAQEAGVPFIHVDALTRSLRLKSAKLL